MGACDTMLKYVVFLFNFVFFLTGIALIGIGAYIQVKMTQYLDFLGETYLNSSVILIIIGVVVLVVAFFGCCGACTESHCMLYTYGTLLAIVLLAAIAVSIVIYLFKNDAKEFVKNAMEEGQQNFGKPDHEGVTETWNLIQHDFTCCGVAEYQDWRNTNFAEVPDSCCKTLSDGCAKGVLDLPKPEAEKIIYTNGCLTSFEHTILGNVGPVAGVAVGVAFLLLLGVLISCCLARNMKERNNYV